MLAGAAGSSEGWTGLDARRVHWQGWWWMLTAGSELRTLLLRIHMWPLQVAWPHSMAVGFPERLSQEREFKDGMWNLTCGLHSELVQGHFVCSVGQINPRAHSVSARRRGKLTPALAGDGQSHFGRACEIVAFFVQYNSSQDLKVKSEYKTPLQ